MMAQPHGHLEAAEWSCQSCALDYSQSWPPSSWAVVKGKRTTAIPFTGTPRWCSPKEFIGRLSMQRRKGITIVAIASWHHGCWTPTWKRWPKLSKKSLLRLGSGVRPEATKRKALFPQLLNEAFQRIPTLDWVGSANCLRAMISTGARTDNGNHQDPDSEPWRNRMPRHAHGEEDGHQNRCGLFRCRRACTPCTDGRRSGAYWPVARRSVLPDCREDHSGL